MKTFPKQLIEGYRTFTKERLPTEQSRYHTLSERGQHPETMVIGCCDSRVAPETIFDAGPGELFVMRNIANLVPVYQPDANAHGVSAAPLSPGDFIGRWMAMFIKPGEVVEQRDPETMKEFATRIEKAAVFRSIENLMTFPFVRKAVESGHMRLHGAYFGVAEGTLYVLDRETKEFRSVRDNSLV